MAIVRTSKESLPYANGSIELRNHMPGQSGLWMSTLFIVPVQCT